MSNQKDLSIIIPFYNEEKSIKEVANKLISTFSESKLVFIDDGSTDKSLECIKKIKNKNIKILINEFNSGYGYSIKKGLAEVSSKYVAWFDADGEHDVQDLLSMFYNIEEQKLAMIIGKRNFSVNYIRKFGKFIIKLFIRFMYNKKISDYNCGLRIFNSKLLNKYKSLLPNGYSASMTSTLIFVYNNYPFGEFEIKQNKIRKFGKSNVVINDGFKSIYNAIRVLTLFNPAIFYSKLGIIIILIGSFYSLYKAFINNIGIPTLGALIIILGILIIFFGLIADQISNLRLSQIDSDNEK